MTTHSVSSRGSGSSRDSVFGRPKLAALCERFTETLSEWRRRSISRRELAALSDLELKDIGYPATTEAEKAKPFWRA
jgi:uncharacterized protein YjiS (DUF1127 family)